MLAEETPARKYLLERPRSIGMTALSDSTAEPGFRDISSCASCGKGLPVIFAVARVNSGPASLASVRRPWVSCNELVTRF
jgi:hypothetical protein